MHRNLIIGFLVVSILCGLASAAPMKGKSFNFTQPDGSKVPVKIWGDEFYQRIESSDGYTLMIDDDGWIRYAELSSDESTFVATDAAYEGKSFDKHPKRQNLKKNKKFKKRLKIKADSRRAKSKANRAKLGYDKLVSRSRTLGGSVSSDVTGSISSGVAGSAPIQFISWDPLVNTEIVALTVCVDFPDQLGTISVAQVEDFLNSPGYTGFDNNGSVHDYFDDVSDGNLNYISVVEGYYTASNDKGYYDNAGRETGEAAAELLGEVFAWLEQENFAFGQLSITEGNEIVAVNIFYAGDASSGGRGLWPHSGTNGAFVSTSGISSSGYQITDMGSSLSLGTFCHESGHLICQWPDLYDYGYDSEGVGEYCLMAFGSLFENNPVPPNAYLRDLKGWDDVTDIVDFTQRYSILSNANESYRYINIDETAEAFYIESRINSGRSLNLPDSGLLVWHVDENGSNDYQQMLPGIHYLVSLEQADGDFDLEAGINSGDGSDLFDSSYKSSFDDSTMPNAHWWDGSDSGLIVQQISDVDSIMYFGPDDSPPYPDPSRWEKSGVWSSSSIITVGSSTIVMMAEEAEDPDGGVLYYFECVTEDTFDSGWVSEPLYVARGLSGNILYEFRVRTKDAYENIGEYSSSVSATTDFAGNDLSAPAPADWELVPELVRDNVTMRAVVAHDDDDASVQYQFVRDDDGDGNVDVTVQGWSTSRQCIDFGVSNGIYNYRVEVQDADGNIGFSSWGQPIIVSATGLIYEVPSIYPTIQDAIDACYDNAVSQGVDPNIYPGTIMIAPNVYTEPINYDGRGPTSTRYGNINLDPRGMPITIQSKFPEDPENVADTIINCEGISQSNDYRDNGISFRILSPGETRRAFYMENGETNRTVIYGLTIINGYAVDGPDWNNPRPAGVGTGMRGQNALGGAIFCTNGASPTIKNCVIKDSYAFGRRGQDYDLAWWEWGDIGDASAALPTPEAAAEGVTGLDGTNGDEAVDDPILGTQDSRDPNGLDGFNAHDFGMGNSGGAGGDGFGGGMFFDFGSSPKIINTSVIGCRAIGGDGGFGNYGQAGQNGGDGQDGQAGQPGADEVVGDPVPGPNPGDPDVIPILAFATDGGAGGNGGNGGDGGDGADGGDGGNGGSAFGGGIYFAGGSANIEIDDSSIIGCSVRPGQAGHGGAGGAGGDGGEGGAGGAGAAGGTNDESLVDSGTGLPFPVSEEGEAGVAGAPGSGGSGGDGGDNGFEGALAVGGGIYYGSGCVIKVNDTKTLGCTTSDIFTRDVENYHGGDGGAGGNGADDVTNSIFGGDGGDGGDGGFGGVANDGLYIGDGGSGGAGGDGGAGGVNDSTPGFGGNGGEGRRGFNGGDGGAGGYGFWGGFGADGGAGVCALNDCNREGAGGAGGAGMYADGVGGGSHGSFYGYAPQVTWSQGGGNYYESNNTVTLTDCTVSGNTARTDNGGGEWYGSGCFVNIIGCKYDQNTAGDGYEWENNHALIDVFSVNIANIATAPFTVTKSGTDTDTSFVQIPVTFGHGGGLFFSKYDFVYGVHRYDPNLPRNIDGVALRQVSYVSTNSVTGILGSFSNVTISDSTFLSNTATNDGDGGAINFEGDFWSELHINDSEFRNNSAESDPANPLITSSGGAIFAGYSIYNGIDIASGLNPTLPQETSLVIEDCIFDENTSEFGGAITAISTDLLIHGDSLIKNNAAEYGGGLNLDFSAAYLYDAIISGNKALDSGEEGSYRNGGGFAATNSSFYASSCVFIDNHSDAVGGAAYINGPEVTSGGLTEQTFVNCLIINNTAAQEGGAISVKNDAYVKVNNSTLADNEVTSLLGSGGGVSCYNAILDIDHSILWGNRATGGFGDQIALGDPTETNNPSSIVTIGQSNYEGGESAVYLGAGGSWFLPDGTNMDPAIDPLFMDLEIGEESDDYYLQPASTSIDFVNSNISVATLIGNINFARSWWPNALDPNTQLVENVLGVTTQVDHTPDSGLLDIGYHYEVIEPGNPYRLTVTIDAASYSVFTTTVDPGYTATVTPAATTFPSTAFYTEGSMVHIVISPDLPASLAGEFPVRVKWTGTDDDTENGLENWVTVDGTENVGIEFVVPDQRKLMVPDEYTNIQEAVDDAVDGDMIMVSPGTYNLTEMGIGPDGIDFKGKAIIFTSKVDAVNPNQQRIADTIIDCGGSEYESRRAFHLHNGEDENTIIRGFTIINGYFSGDGRVGTTGVGRTGLHPGEIVTTEEVGPSDADYWFDYGNSGEDASGDGYGGAILCGSYTGGTPAMVDDSEDAHASPIIEYCVFENNIVTGARGGDGAAGVAASLSWVNPLDPFNNIFEDGQWGGHGGHGDGNGYGGAIACLNGSSPLIRYCTFKNNTSHGGMGGNGGAGGNAVDGALDPTGIKGQGGDPGDAGAIANPGAPEGYGYTGIMGAGSDSFGGAIYTDGDMNNVDGISSSPIFENCVFEGNIASEGAPGLPGEDGLGDDLDDEVTQHGRAGERFILGRIAGGAIFVGDGATLDISECQFIENEASFTYQPFMSIEDLVGVIGGGLVLPREDDYLYGGAINCQNDVTLIINGATDPNKITTFDSNLGGAIRCLDGCDVTINNSVFIKNESPNENGGAICIDDRSKKIQISNSSFSGNISGISGGALFYRDVVGSDPNALISNCSFANNSAEGIYSEQLLLEEGEFITEREYVSDGFGGAICSYVEGGGREVSSRIENCNFQSNNSHKGGAVYLWKFRDTYFADCYVMNNQAYSGGGLYLIIGDFIFDGGRVGLNRATDDWGLGGGIAGQQVEAEIYSTTFEGNSVSGSNGYGGAINFYLTDVTAGTVLTSPVHKIVNCLFFDNSATGMGGALSCEAVAPLIESCTFSDNTADGGGAIYLDYDFAKERYAKIGDSIFSGNTGNAIYEESVLKNVDIQYCLFNGNPDGDYFDWETSYTGATSLNDDVALVGNITDADPRFIEGDRGGYYLHHDSDAVDYSLTQPSTKYAYSSMYSDNKTMEELTVLVDIPVGGVGDPNNRLDLGFHRDPATAATFKLNVSVVAGSGSVEIYNANGQLIEDPTNKVYFEGEQVTLVANPAGNYRINRWTGGTLFDNTPAITNYVIMLRDVDVEVEFESVRIIHVGYSNGNFDYPTIPLAIDAAEDYDIIIVARGIWQAPTGGYGAIYVNKKITIMSTDPTNEEVIADTIIDGTLGTTSSYSRMGVLFGSATDSDTVLNGLTIRNCGGFGQVGLDGDRAAGRPDGVGGMIMRGAGIRIMQGGGPTIKNCVITGNRLWGSHGGNGVGAAANPTLNAGLGGWPGGAHGAGVYCGISSTPTFINCQIIDNEAAGGDGGNGGDAVANGGTANYGGGYTPSNHLYIDSSSSVLLVVEEPLWEYLEFLDDGTYYSGLGGGVFCGNGSTVVFDGCTISDNRAYGGMMGEGGYLTGGQREPFDEYKLPAWGGGVYCGDDSNVSFINECEISDNTADRIGYVFDREGHNVTGVVANRRSPYVSAGGGLAAENGASVTFDNCVIERNEAAVGGGVYWADGATARFTRSEVNLNMAYSGAGLHAANSLEKLSEIIDTIITNNDGTVVPENYTAPNENEVIVDNESSILNTINENDLGIGGGLTAKSVKISVFNTEFSGNSVSESGGAVFFGTSEQDQGYYTMRLENSLIVDNTADLAGGGLAVKMFSQPLVANCTFVKNEVLQSAGYGGGGGIYVGLESVATIVDSILWDNKAPTGSQLAYGNEDNNIYANDEMPSTVNISHTNIQNGLDGVYEWGSYSTLNWQDNVDIDPEFESSGLVDNYYLNQETKLIHRGSRKAADVFADWNDRFTSVEYPFTTSVDGAVDANMIDMGYHYSSIVGGEEIDGGPYSLTVNVAGAIGGTFSLELDGVVIAEDVIGKTIDNIPSGKMVTIRTFPVDETYKVTGWGGNIVDTASIRRVNYVMMDAPDRQALITFGPRNIITVPADKISISQAIDAAEDGDIVMISQGTYYGGQILIDKEITVTSVNPDSPSAVANTIIDCMGPDPDNMDIGRGVTFGPDTTEYTQLNGFTITNCFINPVAATDGEEAGDDGLDGGSRIGGGIFFFPGSAATIRNCVIDGNTVNGGNAGNGADGDEFNPGGNGGWGGPAWGGGVFVGLGARPTFINCTISNNQANGGNGGNGGGYGAGNRPGYGGMFTNPMYEDGSYQEMDHKIRVSIYGVSEEIPPQYATLWNEASDYRWYSGYGGGVFCDIDSQTTFINCNIIGNRVTGGVSGIGGDHEFGIRQVPVYSYEVPTYGGGIYVAAGASASFIDCLIADNESPKQGYDEDGNAFYHMEPYMGHGGGIAAEETSIVILDNCTFSANEASIGGGVFWLGENSDDLLSEMQVIDCDFNANLAYMGAGIFAKEGTLDVEATEFSENFAGAGNEDTSNIDGVGGALYLESIGSTLVDSVIYDNTSTLSGGAIYYINEMYSEIDEMEIDPILFNCLLYDNESYRDGGAISANWFVAPSIESCTIVGNAASNNGIDDSYGGGIFAGYDSNVSVINSILYGNTASQGKQVSIGGGFDQYNTDPPTAAVKISYSNVSGGQSSDAIHVSEGSDLNYDGDGITNIVLDPIFVTGRLGDYYLSQYLTYKPTQLKTSPAINAGSDSASAIGLDRMTTRTNNSYDSGIVNIGYHYPTSMLRIQDYCKFCDIPDTEYYDDPDTTPVEGLPSDVDLTGIDNGEIHRLRPNGTIDFSDWVLVALEWLETCSATDVPGGDMAWCDGTDINKDFIVDAGDISQMAVCWLAEDTQPPMPETMPETWKAGDPIQNDLEWAQEPVSASSSPVVTMQANPFVDAWFTPEDADAIVGDEVLYRYVCYNVNGDYHSQSKWLSLGNPPVLTNLKKDFTLVVDQSYEFELQVKDLSYELWADPNNMYISDRKPIVVGKDTIGPVTPLWDEGPAGLWDYAPFRITMTGLPTTDYGTVDSTIEYMFASTTDGYTSQSAWMTAAEWNVQSGGNGITWNDDNPAKVDGQTYTYVFKAQDILPPDWLPGTTTNSEERSAVAGTVADKNPPEQVAWEFPPYPGAGGQYSHWISMTATTVTDDEVGDNVQYYFYCLEDDYYSSGWQDSPIHTVEIVLGQIFTFQVKARDVLTPLPEAEWNETGWSACWCSAPLTGCGECLR